MRVFIFYFCTLSILLPLAGCQSTSPQPLSNADGQSVDNATGYLHDSTPIASPQVTITVHGLGCPLCAGNIDKQLLRVPGIEDVKVNLNDGTATLRVDPAVALTRNQLAQAIYESGFTLIKIDE